MSDLAFTETVTQDEWVSEGGAGTAERGLYVKVLQYVLDSGEQYHRIPMDRGPFAGKNASSVATALKQARDGKTAPEGADALKITSKGASEKQGTKGVVFIENPAAA